MTEEILVSATATMSKNGPRQMGLLSGGFLLGAGLVVAAAFAFPDPWHRWLPAAGPVAADPAEDDAHAGEKTTPARTIKLTELARKNLKLSVAPIELTTTYRSVTMPGMVVERPGQSQMVVPAPHTGIIEKIYVTQNEMIEPGQKMFDLELKHEELILAQSEFLEMVTSLPYVQSEVTRLKAATSGGATPRKELIAAELKEKELLGQLHAKRQSLILQGLTKDQVTTIEDSKILLGKLTISAPTAAELSKGVPGLTVQRLNVIPGQNVAAGESLAVLSDHTLLYLKGSGFEQEGRRLREAEKKKWPLTAVQNESNVLRPVLNDMKILFRDDHVDPESRALHFYILLPNKIVSDKKSDLGPRFVSWRFQPGQRMTLEVPIEEFEKHIVLPLEAVVEDGADNFVFRQNGDNYDRIPVNVVFRNHRSAVLAYDGSLFPSDQVVNSDAYQLYRALQSQSGQGVVKGHFHADGTFHAEDH